MTSARDQLEVQITTALAEGDVDRALTCVVEGFGPELLGFLEATHPQPDDAHEVFARVCERLVKGLPKFRGDSSLRTWLYTVVVNESRRFFTSPDQKRAQVGLSAISGLVDRARTQTPAHRRTGPKEQFRAFRDALAPDDRMLLILRVDRDLSWKDVATSLSDDDSAKTVAALRKRFERIKTKLAKKAADEGWITAS